MDMEEAGGEEWFFFPLYYISGCWKLVIRKWHWEVKTPFSG
jgi:hypothetical protein